jgi:vancomycin resistance protein YoaR
MARHSQKPKKTTKPEIKKYLLRSLIALVSLVLIAALAVASYVVIFSGKIYPNISVAGKSVAGMTLAAASSTLPESVPTTQELILNYQDQIFKIKAEDIDLNYNFSESASQAYNFTRTGNLLIDLSRRIKLLVYKKNFGLVYSIDNNKLSKIISIIAGQISIDPVEPSISKSGEGIAVNRGIPGREVNQEELASSVEQNLSIGSGGQILIPVDSVDHTLNDTEAGDFATRAEKYLDKSISLKFEYNNFALKDSDIFKLLGPRGGYDDSAIDALSSKTAASIERESQNPKFVFDNGKVTEFQPALDGIRLDTQKFKDQLVQKLDELVSSPDKSLNLDIPVVKTLPAITTDKVNNLGINELIGRGTSTYYHSIASRVHNIVLAASRLNGTLVAPGETFSFNSALGDVSVFTGYQQAYIISEGKTILGDGGGVCQVSTTLFRAILNAGLPVPERQAHAYRVGYYEQDSPPGLDATVYSPSPDLKFTNDTPEYILIEAKADSKNYSLVFELYGTSDGRVSTITKPVVTNVTAPPEDLYQDDPTLPTGTIKQIDFKAWGAKVTYNYSVKRDGQVIYSKTFISNYKPWQAVYLRGTGPAI